MTAWDYQADGSFLGAISVQAYEWAAEDQDKRLDRLAAICFAGWCRDMKLDPFWTTDGWTCLALDGWVVHTLRDVSHDDPDSFCTAYEAAPNTTYAVVRILEGRAPVCHILGLSGTLDQHQAIYDGRPIPRYQLLSCREWLKAFPIHHTPWEG